MRPSLIWDVKQQKLMIVVIWEQPIGPTSRIKKSKELTLKDKTD
jgi:hypothetical protein